MIDLKNFNGIMDTDSPNENIGQHSVKFARNIRYRGEGANMRIENIEGLSLIPFNQPAGTNECIGGFYDDLKQRIFEFIYNSNSFHSIRITYVSTLSRIALLTNGTNADIDCLDFTLDGKIYDVKMLYGDETQGDTLYFINSSNEPCQINIERTLAGTYGTMTRDFLEVIKYPANRPPYVTYGDDATVTVNTMRKKLFRFMTRPVYFSREKSVLSIKSELCLPINAADTQVDQDPTKNCKISIVYETLGADVQYIEILGQVSGKSDENGVVDPNQFSDPFLIQTIDKASLGLSDNDIAIFDFYNNQAYTEIDPEDAIQLFDLVPLEAGAMEMLNGNVPIYGAITEGFDLIPITATVTPSSIPEADTQLPYVFVGSQSGDSAFGTGVIHIILVGTIEVGYNFSIVTTNNTLSVSAAAPTTNGVLSQLSVAATLAGFTTSIVVDDNNLLLEKSGESLQIVVRQGPVLGVTNGPVYNWNDKEAYCLNYFDKGGRTAGSQTIENMSFQTPNYTETLGVPNIPQLLLSVTNRPPIDAFYFTIGRTKSLAKLKFLYWVSNSTYKDTEFAYIGIQNLNTFIEANKSDPNKPSNSAHLAYDFTPGDRIRFIKVLSGTVNTIYTQQDFSIIGQALSPNINGTVREGQFIKISLPTTSATFDFGTTDFANYEIELYTPAQSVANSLNKFYEFGERYTIGNPGTATRYHQGMTQNQTSNLSQPATFTFNKGDFYYRNRQINVGAEYNYNFPAYEQGIGRTTLALNFTSQSYSDPNITPGSSPNQNLVGFNLATNTDRAILNVTTGTYFFRMKGAIIVSFNDFGENFRYYLQDSLGNVTDLVPMQPITQGPHTYPIDVTFQMLPNTRMFIFGYSQGDYRNSKTYSEVDFKITRQLPYTVPVIDANYSDYFPSALNSNGRPLIEEPSAARSYNPILLRWGKPNLINTNINEVSRFTVLNFTEIDGAKGDIMSLIVRNRILEVLQKRACGWFAIYAKVLQNNQGQDVITTTNEIITQNNIQYLQGDYGPSYKGSITKSKNGYWFTDTIRGYQIRRSQDGLTPVNELFLGQYFIRNIITKYNDSYIRPNGATSIIISYFDYFEEQYVSFFQGGTFDGNTIPDEGLSFNENHKGYCCFYDEIPEWIVCAQDITFEWRAGQIYIRNNTSKYGERFGVQTYPSVTIVFNKSEPQRRLFNTISYQSNFKWSSPVNGNIKTSEFNEDTGLQQISSLIENDYKQRGNYFDAPFNRDANSMADAREALLDGDYLNGVWIEAKLTYFGDKFVTLFSPYVLTEGQPRNF